VRVEELGSGLWRWVAFHEEWRQDVGCVYVESPEAVCLIDPLVPADDRDVFLRHLDADVARAAQPVHVLLTIYWHVRSAAEIVERYDATLWAPARSVLPVERRTGIRAEGLRPGTVAPGPIAAHASGRAAELVYRIPAHATLVAGDVLLGDPLRICPPGWVGKGGQEAVREALRPLAEPSLRAVVTSHGDPVLEHGGAALAKALGRAAPDAR
jgi:glyoxylase-like metal-dependent hydrolase (beta-lactamase superfamily II)